MSRPGSRHGQRQVFPSCGCFQGTVAVSHCACIRIPQRPWAGLQVCLRAEALGRLPAAGFHSQARPGLSRASGVGSAVSAGLPLSALAFQDLVRMVEQLARFLGVSCDKAQLEALTEHCHQLVDQCCNAEALPVGRGTRPAAPFLCPCPPPPAGVRCPPHQGSAAPRPAPRGTWRLGRRWPRRVSSSAACPASQHVVVWFTGGLLGCVRLCGQDVSTQVPSQTAPQGRVAQGFGAVNFRAHSTRADSSAFSWLVGVNDAGGVGPHERGRCFPAPAVGAGDTGKGALPREGGREPEVQASHRAGCTGIGQRGWSRLLAAEAISRV